MAKKLGKSLLALVAVGAAVGAGIAYLKKRNEEDIFEDEFEDDFEDEDFDLDNDLEPVPDREYVTINNKDLKETDSEQTEEAPVSEESSTSEDKEEA